MCFFAFSENEIKFALWVGCLRIILELFRAQELKSVVYARDIVTFCSGLRISMTHVYHYIITTAVSYYTVLDHILLAKHLLKA